MHKVPLTSVHAMMQIYQCNLVSILPTLETFTLSLNPGLLHILHLP